MHEQINLPPETLHLIFSYLLPQDLYRCLFVSHSWSGVAETQLYSNITLHLQRVNSLKIVSALKTRKHLLRRFELQPCSEFAMRILLDIFLDYRQEEDHDQSLPYPGYSHRHHYPTVADLGLDDTKTRPAFPQKSIGPNRPNLTHFSIVGFHESGWILDTILFTLTTLTTLKIHFFFSGSLKTYTIDFDRILDTMPHLKHLSIDGHKHRYRFAEDFKDSSSSSETTSTSTTHALAGSRKVHCLESFTFEPTRLMRGNGPMLSSFRRLGNLRRIQVNAAIPYFSCHQKCQPWKFGQALRQHCPKLENIGIDGPVPLWLFGLTILPFDKIDHIKALAEENMPAPILETLGDLGTEMNHLYRLTRLQEQEATELLEGKFAEPYFPQLKTLVLKGEHCLSVQDLFSLGAQARFLTRLEIQQWPAEDKYILEMYDTDAAAAVTAAESTIHSSSTESNALIEDRRLRKRQVFGEGDVAAFLHNCASLCQFSVTGHIIPYVSLIFDHYFHLAAAGPGGNKDTEARETKQELTRGVRPWACEERLETLRFGFGVSAEKHNQHKVIWKHLGRFRKLRYLHLDLSTLLPLPKYGVEGLLEGGMSETVEEIRSLPGWWKAKDRRELVLWFARSFPKLRVLGLAHHKWYVDGKRGETYCAFLEDEEVFAVIFGYSTRQALYRCLFVSRLWHDQAEAQLYSNISLHAQKTKFTQLVVPALKTRRHLLRRFEWRSYKQEMKSFEKDLIDILLDYRAPDNNLSRNNDSDSGSAGRNAFSFNSKWLSQTIAKAIITTPPSSTIGPRRAGLTHFSFIGGQGSKRLLDLVMFNLTPTTLTTLELDFEYYSGTHNCTLDLERILTTFPYLKRLSVVGWMLTYAPTTTGLQEERKPTHPGRTDDTIAGSKLQQQHRLESFTIGPVMMEQSGPYALTVFQRLGSLKKITIGSQAPPHWGWDRGSRPWAFGRVLRQHCPKLESIHFCGPVVLWLYDLPALSFEKSSLLTSLVTETMALSDGSASSTLHNLAQMRGEERLKQRLQEQEQGELLTGNAAEPFFPRLKTLILGQDHSLSSQDLILLGVQSRLLTRLDILFQPTRNTFPWDIYEKDALATASVVDVNSFHHSTNPNSIKLLENRLLRKRRPFSSKDVLLFLQHCSSLRFLSLKGCIITYEDLINTPTTSLAANTVARTPFIQPWACEQTLETLIIRLDVSDNLPEHHALLWKHLGRFKNLRSLTLTSAPTYRGRSTLNPSFRYGVEGLFEGKEGGGGMLRETLQEIRTLTNWWKVQDRRETVLWFARMCPKLRVLGLAFNGEFAEGDKGALYTSFLQDEETEMLDVLFDCGGREGLPVDVSLANSIGNAGVIDLVAAEVVLASRMSTAATGGGGGGGGRGANVEPAIRLGPNRPALQRFEFESIWLFETTIYNLPLLTTLVLHMDHCRQRRLVCIDVDRILDTIPCLKQLHLEGPWHTYTDNTSSSSSTATKTTFCTRVDYEPKKEVRNHPLESLTCLPRMMSRSAPSTLATFRRLGNLKSISFKSTNEYFERDIVFDPNTRAQPGEFGQILQQYCPKIESIETYPNTVLWLFRLPAFSSAYKAILFSTNVGAGPEGLSDAEKERLTMELQQQEMLDILTLREETAFFPRLKSFVAMGRSGVGAQDLLALAAHSSQFLTHLEIWVADITCYAYHLLQDPLPTAATAAEGIDQITIYPSEPISQAEKRRLRQRRPARSLDYEMVLETCASLKVVTLPGWIDFRHMETLESLTVGFLIPRTHKSDHRLVWRHLGRLRKLQSLTLTHSTLIPALDFGMDELVGVELKEDDDDAVSAAEAPAAVGDGKETQHPRQPQEDRLREQNRTLQNIHSLGELWGVDDRKTVEWFARSFPNLLILGLGFRWGKSQHRRVMAWLSEIEHSFELEFMNDLSRKK
ncbi:hypothetical protein BGZ95_009064 [Linnemannia exigua]|uniref:F-box domain-containing protein n=1 Tax=Linnemannia exigua TaxID=604196 RepID=A0AAD4H859_9FUNG|nr:hypothetical protein BGZ95_009064 [Linnemannia exigua]